MLQTDRERENNYYGSHKEGKVMIIIMKTLGSQVDSSFAEGKRREGEGGEIRDLHKNT